MTDLEPGGFDPYAEIERLNAENQQLRAENTGLVLAAENDARRMAQLRFVMNLAGMAYMEKQQESEGHAESASTDDLTGLLRRTAFEGEVFNAVAGIPPESKRRHYSTEVYSIVLLDLDHFSDVNGAWGHNVGDETLRKVADQLHVREDDLKGLAARWGGEEMVLCLPWTNRDGAVQVAWKLRDAIENEVFLPNGKPVTASFGVAEGNVSEISTNANALTDVIGQADAAMYLAKHRGRNTVAYYNPENGDAALAPRTE